MTMTATYALGRGIDLQRVFNAPPDVVFEAWTDPEALDWFFNPGVAVDHPTTVDLRVGGQWRQQMAETPEKKYFTGGLYREIAPSTKLSFNWGAVGGWPELDLADPDASPLVIINFKPNGTQTMMDFRVLFPDQYTDERVDWWMNCGMIAGWNMTIDRLLERYPAPQKLANVG